MIANESLAKVARLEEALRLIMSLRLDTKLDTNIAVGQARRQMREIARAALENCSPDDGKAPAAAGQQSTPERGE